MKNAFILPLLVASLFLNASCQRRVTSSDKRDALRAMPPFTTANEWLKQFEEIQDISLLYPKLPPQTEWPEISDRLTKLEEPLENFSVRTFSQLLAGDAEGASISIRALLEKNPGKFKDYSRDSTLIYLYQLSTDLDATQQWVEKNYPEKPPETSTYKRESSAFETYLKYNKIDDALVLMREEVDRMTTEPDEQFALLGKLTKIARLMDREDVYQKSFKDLQVKAGKVPKNDSYSIYSISDALDELMLKKDWDTLRKLLPSRMLTYGSEEFQALRLIITYHAEGHAALLAEIKKSTDHGINDRQAYLDLLTTQVSSSRETAGEVMVRALMLAGRKDEARVTLTYLLPLAMGNDSIYRLVIEYFPEQAQAMFEAIRSWNPYEERPLIWLSELALGRNDLPLARKLIDEAIALDPSDGEQGKFTRMQAYDVLSRILRAGGDTTKADFFAEVTRSIREGEEADDFLHVGLTDEAVRRYQQALGHFQDAYCLQSRLAKTLLEQGKVEESMVHFKKAFELMPLSFGPVESHCFGCEGIFTDERVQQVAMQTFNRMIGTSPENPRTFYLLGLVLEEMNRPTDAITAMEKAMELDPDYYNCAKRLLTLQQQIPSMAKKSQVTQARLAKIAPYRDLQDIYRERSDIKQTWIDAQNPPPCPIKLEPFPLPFTPKQDKFSQYSRYYGDSQDALDGWTTEELLQSNRFLMWLQML